MKRPRKCSRSGKDRLSERHQPQHDRKPTGKLAHRWWYRCLGRAEVFPRRQPAGCVCTESATRGNFVAVVTSRPQADRASPRPRRHSPLGPVTPNSIRPTWRSPRVAGGQELNVPTHNRDLRKKWRRRESNPRLRRRGRRAATSSSSAKRVTRRQVRRDEARTRAAGEPESR